MYAKKREVIKRTKESDQKEYMSFSVGEKEVNVSLLPIAKCNISRVEAIIRRERKKR